MRWECEKVLQYDFFSHILVVDSIRSEANNTGFIESFYPINEMNDKNKTI